ncbi:hypothetical protein ACFOET_13305 [Parapedobacter deserti]|uniref:Uncharacterized protein n=1 Tax=Parapedobacter deserti TaxID=1912957 RepID=A0ABV7JP60_9SPHI
METFIPILIALLVFAFQAYANFQKEQEKARKRNLGQPPLPEDNAQRPFVDQQPPMSDPGLPYPGHRLPEPERRSSPAEQRPPITTSRVPTSSHRPPGSESHPGSLSERFGRYSGVLDAEKFGRLRQSRQQRTIQRLEVDEGVTTIAASDNIDFDLRDAVIKSAILERPYQ